MKNIDYRITLVSDYLNKLDLSDEIKEYLNENNTIKGRLVSENNDYLNFLIRPTSSKIGTYAALSDSVEQIASRYTNGGDKYETHIGGQSYFVGILPNIIANEIKILILSGEKLKDIINNTSYAASKDDLKPVLQGVLFQIENKGIVSVATDGHRLVKLENKNLHNIDYSGNVVIPTKFLKLLSYQLNKENEVSIFIGDNHVQVQLEKTTITTRIIKDPYPDYEGVIPKENTKTLIINRDLFVNAIKRISIFSNKLSSKLFACIFVSSRIGDLLPISL